MSSLINQLEEVRSHVSESKRTLVELQAMDKDGILPYMREVKMKLMEANYYLNDMHELLCAINELETKSC